MIYLPIQTIPDQTVTYGPLDGASYVFRFRWNMRGGWTFSMADESEQPIFGLRGLVLGTDFLDLVRSDPRVPPGKLLLVDLTDSGVEPGYTDLCGGPSESDLRGRCALMYVEASELP